MKAGVNTQMYLKSLALQNGTNPPSFSDPVIVGANMCRKAHDMREHSNAAGAAQALIK